MQIFKSEGGTMIFLGIMFGAITGKVMVF